MRRTKRILAAALAVVVGLGYAQAAQARGEPGRDELLGKGWRTSADRMWTTSGDATGFHLLVAEARTGYAWRTVATLSRPGVVTDRWIGNACVTGSGDRAVVVYAPRTFTNKEDLTSRGGFTATVDLNTGAVRRLAVRTSLAYFNPGCGAGEAVALTQEGGERTGIFRLDAGTARLSRRIEVPGQLTSAVPTDRSIVVAGQSGLWRVADDGKLTAISPSRGVPYRLTPDAQGRVVFLDGDAKQTRVRRTGAVDAGGKPATAATLASGPLGGLDVRAGAGGQVFVTGRPTTVGPLPPTVRRLDVPAGAEVSTRGEAAVTRADTRAVPEGLTAEPVRITATSLRTGRQLPATVDPAETLTPRDQDMTDPAATCAIRRNDVLKQVYQPKPKQVEWAVDMAIFGALNVERPAGWHGNGLTAAYKPQTMFPPIGLIGGGRVPAQVMLGILGQESNLWQASRLLYPGDYGNPLIGNYYGLEIYNDTEADDWAIDFPGADCGYGVSQMTDGMRAAGRERPGETALPYAQQVAIATDYAANVAAGMNLLKTKWNRMKAAGMTLNNGDPSKLENWFLAVWAYNSGFHEQGEAGANGAWGLGWLNNPVNPRYPIPRHPFGSDPHDFARPQQWPYPEKVMGFAANPPSGFEDPLTEVPFFRAAWWNGTDGDENTPGSAKYNRANVKPLVTAFCVDFENQCYPGTVVTPNAPEVVGEPAGPCQHRNAAGQYDLKCWWHSFRETKANCALTCGNEFIRYDWDNAAHAVEPANGTSFPPVCGTADLPPDALVVDDVGRTTAPARQTCPRTYFADGTFSMTFGRDASGQEAAKIDLHQASGGYGAHYFLGHTRPNTAEGRMLETKATWTLGRKITTMSEVWVFVPRAVAIDNTTPNTYVVTTAYGPQAVSMPYVGPGAGWVKLGTFPFNNNPSVTLSTINGNGNERMIAFDAVAFLPTAEPIEGTSKIVKIIHDASGKCLVSPSGVLDPGMPAVQRTCIGSFEENWLITLLARRHEVIGAGEVPVYDFRIQNRVTGGCLEVAGGSTAEGAPVVQGTCASSDGRHIWTSQVELTVTPPGSFQSSGIGTTPRGRGLAIPNCRQDDGAPAVASAGSPDGLPDCPGDTFSTVWRWGYIN